MANFQLTNGYSVSTAPQGTGTEFTTRNPEGAVISTVTFYGEDARELMRDLVVSERLAAL